MAKVKSNIKTAQQRIKEIYNSDKPTESVAVINKPLHKVIDKDSLIQEIENNYQIKKHLVEKINHENQMEFMLPKSGFKVDPLNASVYDKLFSEHLATQLGNTYEGVTQTIGGFFGKQNFKEVLTSFDQGQIISRLFILTLVNAVAYKSTNDAANLIAAQSAELEAALKHAYETIDKLQIELQSYKDSKSDVSVEELRLKLKTFGEQANIHKAENEMYKARVDELQGYLNNANEIVETQQKVLARTEVLYEDVKAENLQLKQQVEEFSNALEVQDKELREAYEAELIQFQNDIIKREEDYQTLKAILEKEVEDLKKENEALKASKPASKAQEAISTNHVKKGTTDMDFAKTANMTEKEVIDTIKQAIATINDKPAVEEQVKARENEITFGDMALYTAATVGVAAVAYVTYNLVKDHFFSEE